MISHACTTNIRGLYCINYFEIKMSKGLASLVRQPYMYDVSKKKEMIDLSTICLVKMILFQIKSS